jgi:hypothetical protein
MKKADQIRFWLDQDLPPKQIAERAHCALSWVYHIRGRAGMAALRHEMGVIREELWEVRERLHLIEDRPTETIKRLRHGRAAGGSFQRIPDTRTS